MRSLSLPAALVLVAASETPQACSEGLVHGGSRWRALNQATGSKKQPLEVSNAAPTQSRTIASTR